MSRLLLVVPCFNEEASLGALLGEAARELPDADLVVVDDGSRDRTAAVARAAGVPCLRLACNLGIGGAVQTGLRYALARGYDRAVQLDGDGQHPPGEVRRLLEVQAASGASIVVGSRFLGGGEFRSSPARRLGIGLIAATLRLFFGRTVTDPTSGLRLLDSRAIAFFAERYPLDYPEPISLGLALAEGLGVAEAPVTMRPRVHGESSIRGLDTLAYVVRVIGYLALARLGGSR